jgi:hypothetical protein
VLSEMNRSLEKIILGGILILDKENNLERSEISFDKWNEDDDDDEWRESDEIKLCSVVDVKNEKYT